MPGLQEAGGAALSSPTDDRPTAEHAPAGLRRRTLLVLVLAVLVCVVDQATKVWALAALTPGEPVDLLGRWLRLNLIHNAGAAFSLGDRATWVLTAVALVIVVVGARAAWTVTHRGWAIGLGLILGGAVGNLVDRLVREPGPFRGHVVDFIDYAGLFIGNVADIAIVGAAVWVGWLAMRGVPLTPPSAGPDHETADDPGAER